MIYSFTLVFVILLIGLIFLAKKRKKKTVQNNHLRQQTLIYLNELLKELDRNPDAQSMYKDEIDKVRNEIEQKIEEIIEGKLKDISLKEKADELSANLNRLKDNVKKEFFRKDELIKRIENEVGKFKNYLDSNVFYPKEFVFTANKLQGKIIDIQEVKMSKLSRLLNDTEKELNSFQEEMKCFLNLHSKLKLLITNNPELTGNLKQEIYFYLQQGELKKAEELMINLSQDNNMERLNEIEK